MNAVAGLIGGDSGEFVRLCNHMLAAQRLYGPDKQSVGSLGNVTFGHCLFRLLAEDAFDLQPVIGCGGAAMLVADLRIDNSDELIARFDVAQDAKAWSDSRLLMHAYEVWGIGLLDHVIGDFAFAIWDRRSDRLYLGCDPTGQRPLHYRVTPSRVEFSSMPVGLIAVMPGRAMVDAEKIAAFVDKRRSPLSSSYLEGIFRVPPGHYVVFDSGVRTERRYWDPQPKTLRLARTQDYVDAFHAHLEQAVKARLRDAGAIVGTQLSSGRDSSAITAIAARLLEPTGGRVLSATGAPRAGFAGAAPDRKAIDESAVAAETARKYANVAHIVVRPEHSFDFDDCERLWDYYQEPFLNACNFPWLAGINRTLGEHGVSVLLTGDLGNLTISAGGYAILPDFLWQGSWRSCLREFRILGAEGRMRWRGALAVTAGGYIPPPIWALLARATGRSSQDPGRPLLQKAWQSTDRTGSIMAQPPRNTYSNRVDQILNTSIAGIRKGNLAQFGIDERDPTSDRRLIEFCLSLPADQLLKDGIERPLFIAAMTDLVAPDVIAGTLRGLQAADWYASYSRASLQGHVSTISGNDRVAAIIDVEALEALVGSWPERGHASPSDAFAFRARLMKTLSAAHFIQALDAKTSEWSTAIDC